MTTSAPPTTSETTWRQRLERIIDSPLFQNTVLVVILINAATIGLQTAFAHDTVAYEVLHLIDMVAVGIFVVEIAMKLVAYGPKRFFSSGWNVFDFLVTVIALIPASGPLSVLRALRVLRVLRVIRFFPQVRRVVDALLHSLPGIAAIAVLMVIVFYVAAVMATVMFGEAFPEWFGDLGKSLYSLFQIMTLESWSMGIVRPVMEESPWAWAFFVPFILISAFVTLNLFIAVIVDTMSTLRDPAADAASADSAEDPALGADRSEPAPN